MSSVDACPIARAVLRLSIEFARVAAHQKFVTVVIGPFVLTITIS